MKRNTTYDDDVSCLAAVHLAVFEHCVPDYSDLKTGSYALVDKLCADIERELTPGLTKLFAIDQIKKKFGTFRFNWCLGDQIDLHVDIFHPGANLQSSDVGAKPFPAATAEAVNQPRDQLRELVNAACAASASPCQRCGTLGSLRRLASVQTLCDKHFVEVTERDAKEVERPAAEKMNDEPKEGDGQ